MFGKLTQDSTDRMFRRAPPPLASIIGANALVAVSIPKTFVSNSRRMSSRSLASRSSLALPIPALLTRSVTSPARPAAAVTEAGSVTSKATGMAPSASIESGLRAPAYTVAPRRSSSMTNCLPRPRLAPVTRAVQLDRSILQ